MKYNKDVNRRDNLLFGEDYNADKYHGGTREFESVNLETLQTLLDEDFISPYECQNCSPSTEEFMEFMEEHPGFYAHGYAVALSRKDYRITLEGIACDDDVDVDTLKDFIRMCRYADDFDVEPLYAKWD